jgi:hypothetical protein
METYQNSRKVNNKKKGRPVMAGGPPRPGVAARLLNVVSISFNELNIPI